MNLQLSLKKQWFEMTKAGIKTEDYREITPYWAKRIMLQENEYLIKMLSNDAIEHLCHSLNSCETVDDRQFIFRNWRYSFKEFAHNIMTLGYPKSTDTERILKLEHRGIYIGYGNPEWGAEPNKLYFIIKHGKII